MTEASAWLSLPKADEDAAWSYFCDVLHFPMGVRPGREPAPSITYAIAHVFAGDAASRAALEDDLNRSALAAFRQCVGEQGRVYALDWQHECYWFYPHCAFDERRWECWKVPVLPDGDNYVFLAEDFSFCLYGDCVALTICVFGQALLDAFAQHQPALFTHPIRIDGRRV